MTFELARLSRRDLEALVALKLVEEVGTSVESARALLRKVDEGWMRRFLASGPPAIGSEPLGVAVLGRARLTAPGGCATDAA